MTSKKNSLKKLKGLYVIIDPAICLKAGNNPLKTARAALKGGVKVIQLRYKEVPDTEILRMAGLLKSECLKYNALFIMNDRADLAAMVAADGLHLGQNDLPVKDARKIFNGFIGVSTHNEKEVKKAVKYKADCIGFGPVFPTKTKQGLPETVGLKKLAQIVKKVKFPVIAIGGINENNIGEVFKSGATCAAVIGAVCGAKNPREKTRKLLMTID